MDFKVIIAGCGGMSKIWLEYALSRPDVHIAALVDISVHNAERLAEEYQLKCRIYEDMKQAIKETGANLVFDVTVPKSHKDITVQALEMGCHVFGEKPMGASLEEAKEMLQTAQKTGRTFAVMQNRRYNKQIRALKSLITSGVIGKPGYICADFFLGPHFGGFREKMESPLILDMAIHTFDQARFLIGRNPVSVYCDEFNPSWSWYEGNAAAVCIFRFDDGTVFCYRGAWCAEGSPTSWEASWRIVGSKGTAIWDGTNEPFAEVVENRDQKQFIRDAAKVYPSSEWRGREGHIGCLDEMFSALKEGRKPETDCSDNIKSVAMVYSAIESAKLGKQVTISY